MRTHMKGTALVLAVVVLLAAMGCGSHEEPKPVTGDTLRTDLVGKVWTVESLFARRLNGELTMEFLSDGTVKVFGGCNDLTGTYTLDGEALSFGPMTPTTRKACGPVLDEQEYSFKTFLARIDSVKVDGGELHLLSKELGEPIVLTAGSGGLFW